MLWKRLIGVLFVAPPVALAVWLGGWWLTALAFIVFTLVNYEFFSFSTGLSKARVVHLTITALMIPIFYLVFGWAGLGVGIWVSLIVLCWKLLTLVEREEHELLYEVIPAAFVGLLYTGGLGSAMIIATREVSNVLVFWLLITVIATDSFAYFGGRYFQGVKLAPRLSPNKTVSGAVIGVFGGVLVSGLVAHFFEFPMSIYEVAFYALLVTIMSIGGDLTESLFKRVYGTKDAGSLIPGHGGLLDRVDGIIFAMPICFLLPFSS